MLNTKSPSYIEPMTMDPPFGAFRAMYGIKDNLIIYHGAIGCAASMRVIPVWHDHVEPKVPTTYLSEKDIIDGTRDKLRDALIKAYGIYKPSLMTVITGSIADILNEDLEAVIKKVEDVVNCKILLINSETLEGDQRDGFIRATCSVIKSGLIKEAKANKNTLNLFGVFNDEFLMTANMHELNRLLNIIGVKIACPFFSETTIDDIANSKAAQLNGSFMISQDLESIVNEYLGTPLNYFNYPFGINGTEEFLLKIARHLNLSPSSIDAINDLKCQYSKAYGKLAQVATDWQELPVAILGGPDYCIPFINYLENELGFDVTLYVNTSLNKLSQEQSGMFNNSIKLVEHENMEEIAKIIKGCDVKLMFGSSLDSFIAKDLSIPYVNITFPVWEELQLRPVAKPLMGFEGTLEVCERIFASLNSNPKIKF